MALSSRHRSTLASIFSDPVSPNIRWDAIEALVRAAGGEVRQRTGSRVAFVLSGRVAVFHEPHPEKVAKRATVRDMRAFLTSAGITP